MKKPSWNLREAVERVLDPRESWQASSRDIVCTPTFGAYDRVAYWVVVLNGSPPKAAIIQTGWNMGVRLSPGFPRPYLVDSQGKFKQAVKRQEYTLNALACALAEAVPADGFERPCVFILNKSGEVVPFAPKKVSP